MTPPNPSNLLTLKNHGATTMLYHGTSAPIFSGDDTASVEKGVVARYKGSGNIEMAESFSSQVPWTPEMAP